MICKAVNAKKFWWIIPGIISEDFKLYILSSFKVIDTNEKKNTKIFLSILSIFMYFFVNRKQKADLQI